MATGIDLLENLETLDIEATAEAVLQEKSNTIADLNAAQMAQGLRSDGSEILPAYAALTIELKKKKSGLASITDHVTLFDTGSHYKEMYAELKGEEIEYGSRDPKSADLQKKYDKRSGSSAGSIYGLTTDSKEELATVTGPLWQTKIEEQTGLKFN